MNCSTDINIKPYTGGCSNVTREYTFKDGKCYIDGIYFGDIVYSDESVIQVVCKNGNKYMDGMLSVYHKV